jgi:hypothetical protein
MRKAHATALVTVGSLERSHYCRRLIAGAGDWVVVQ